LLRDSAVTDPHIDRLEPSDEWVTWNKDFSASLMKEWLLTGKNPGQLTIRAIDLTPNIGPIKS
jgi:hypothetical protein